MKTRIHSIVKKCKEAKIMSKKSILAIMLGLCFVFGVIVASGTAAKAASAVTFLQPSQWTNGCYTWNDGTLSGAKFIWSNDMTIALADPTNNFGVCVNYFDHWAKIEANDSLPAAVRDWTVKQRLMPNGSAEITVIETGTNAPAIALSGYDFRYPSGNYSVCGNPYPCGPSYEAILGKPGVCIYPPEDLNLGTCEGCTGTYVLPVIKTDLLVDYMCVIKFYIDSPIYNPDTTIPVTIADFFFGNTSAFISVDMILSGKGTLTDRAAVYGFTPDKTAEISMKMKWLNNTGGILKGHYPGRFKYGFPVEYVNIREVK